jgi:hypothetical protein
VMNSQFFEARDDSARLFEPAHASPDDVVTPLADVPPVV